MAPIHPPKTQTSDELSPFASFLSLQPEDVRTDIVDADCTWETCTPSLADFDFSATALCIMKIIVAMAVLACVVETVSILWRWCKCHAEPLSGYPPSRILLLGPEGVLQTHPQHPSPSMLSTPNSHDRGYSPGVEKKNAAYAVLDKQRREAQRRRMELEDEGDELNWPVL